MIYLTVWGRLKMARLISIRVKSKENCSKNGAGLNGALPVHSRPQASCESFTCALYRYQNLHSNDPLWN